MQSQPSTNGPPSPLWRIALAIGLLLAAGLLLALWPALTAISGAFTAAIVEHRWLVGLALLSVLVALLAGVVRAVWAWSWRLDAKARQAAILQLQNGLPIHVGDVRQIAVQESHFSLERHYAALLAEAERAMPNLTSFNQHLHIEQAAASPQSTEAAPALPQLPGSRGGTLAQLHRVGHVCRSGNSLLVGYEGGQPRYIELAECGFIGVGGKPRVGKSTTTLLLINQAVLSGWYVFVGDPHIAKEDSLLKRCRPLSGRLGRQGQATTPDEIAAMVYLVDKIGRRRVNGDPDRTPVLLIIDEFTQLVWREQLPADIFRILPSMAIEYAGVGVHGLIISHDYSRSGLGTELGAALRRSFTHRIAHQMDPGNVEFLLPKGSAAQARAVSGLEKGQALYHGPDGSAMVAVPLVDGADGEYAAQGAAPAPYALRPQPLAAPAQVPPTVHVTPRPAPPTDPLPPLTVQSEILLLLSAQRAWLTASEIAAKLNVDLGVVRTEIDTLYNNKTGQLVRRSVTGKRTKEKYEYQIAQSVQSIQPHLTPSA